MMAKEKLKYEADLFALWLEVNSVTSLLEDQITDLTKILKENKAQKRRVDKRLKRIVEMYTKLHGKPPSL